MLKRTEKEIADELHMEVGKYLKETYPNGCPATNSTAKYIVRAFDAGYRCREDEVAKLKDEVMSLRKTLNLN